MKSNQPKAVCLFSGGLDSTTALYVAIRDGFLPLGLTFDYGQLHRRELESARWIAGHLRIDHQIILVQLPWGGSALLDSSISIPESRDPESIPHEIPATYVPARNTVFLSFAASYAEASGAEAIFIGANALDYSGYPDCRPEYFRSFRELLQLGTKQGISGKPIRIEAPLLQMKKSEIIRLALQLNVPFERTWSCYCGESIPCGRCDACMLRAKGFSEAGFKDPALAILATQ